MKKHALLSASSSKRWLMCPPSARLEENLPEEKTVYAEEGTFAHKVAEVFINFHIQKINKDEFATEMNKLSKSPFYTQELLDYLDIYISFAVEKINSIKNGIALIEQRLDFSQYVPEGFGTGDLVLIDENLLEIVDLKYGRGVAVEAQDNTQIRLYVLGALNQFECLYDIDTVKMTICQPRLDSITTEEVKVKDLKEWGENFVKPRAELAYKGEGEFCAGEHCRFCRARFTCRKRAEENLKLIKLDFKNEALLDDTEVLKILNRIDEIKRWADDIYTYALSLAVNEGKVWEGFKLVEGRSNRKFIDEKKVVEKLFRYGLSEGEIYTRSLNSITALERKLGKEKFNEILGDFVIKPQGKLTLVKETDKRPEFNSPQEDFS
ncbi:DUF2800 domain-containing protein [Caloramator australicus]|uniref:Phage protein n=1 Tax=Caloramator australicus RC3 TaxID=857293 RepID=I7KTD6_9CLOT|nr:DUF2800 domain-containing protein [Caloramator australicus]CCJ32988.1 Phage protein [Caloramator australicus RC3]